MRKTAGQRTRALTLLLALFAPLGATALHTAPPEGDPPPAGVAIEETETEAVPERLALLPLQARTG